MPSYTPPSTHVACRLHGLFTQLLLPPTFIPRFVRSASHLLLPATIPSLPAGLPSHHHHHCPHRACHLLHTTCLCCLPALPPACLPHACSSYLFVPSTTPHLCHCHLPFLPPFPSGSSCLPCHHHMPCLPTTLSFYYLPLHFCPTAGYTHHTASLLPPYLLVLGFCLPSPAHTHLPPLPHLQDGLCRFFGCLFYRPAGSTFFCIPLDVGTVVQHACASCLYMPVHTPTYSSSPTPF